MKRGQRQAWIDVDPSYILCNWCRFMEAWRGWQDCIHPLADAIQYSQAIGGMEPGDDCWAFRLRKGLTLEGAREIVAANKGEREGE